MRFSRFLPVILLLVISVPLLAFSASAASDSVEFFNYRDYEDSVVVDGDMDIVTINFPIDRGYGSVAASDWTTLSTWTGANSPRVWLEAGYYHFMVNPFGDNTYLSLKNIPDDAKFTLRFGLSGFSTNTDWTLSWVRMFERYIKDDVVTRNSFYVNRDDTGEADLIEFGTSDTFSRGYDGYAPEYDLYVYIPSARNCYMDVYQFSCTMKINSYYRVLDEMGYSEQIDELRQELADQNKKLDDFLEYEPDDSPPPQQEQLDKVEDSENQLMDSVNDGFNEAYDLFDSVNIFFGSLQPALLAVASILGEFIGLDTSGVPGFYVLVSISMALGVLGVLLSIGTQLSKSSWSYEGKYVRGKGGHK